MTVAIFYVIIFSNSEKGETVIKDKIAELIDKHSVEINKENLEPIILDIYSQCGANGVAYFKELVVETTAGVELYDKTILKIIKGILGA